MGRAPGLDLATLGVYGAAAEIAGLTRKVRFAAEAPFLHALATAQGRGRGEEERSAFGDVVRWMLPALLCVAAALALGAPLWLSLFGPGFERATLLVGLLVVAHSISGHSGFAENVLLLRRPALNLMNSTFGVAAYLVLSLVLVPRMGATGAALAAVAAYGVVAALRFGELRAMGVPWPSERIRETSLGVPRGARARAGAPQRHAGTDGRGSGRCLLRVGVRGGRRAMGFRRWRSGGLLRARPIPRPCGGREPRSPQGPDGRGPRRRWRTQRRLSP